MEVRTEDVENYIKIYGGKGFLIFAPPIYPHQYQSNGILEAYCASVLKGEWIGDADDNLLKGKGGFASGLYDY